MCDEFQVSSIVSLMPEALLDTEKTLLGLRQARSSQFRRPLVSLCEKFSLECEQQFHQFSEEKMTLERRIKQLGLETERIKKEVQDKTLQEKTTRNQILSQRKILSNAMERVPDKHELSELMSKICTIKDDIEKKKNDLKSEMQKFQRGILYYKKYLLCTVMVDSKDSLIMTFDTTAKSAAESREYLKFSWEENLKTFKFLEMRPKLKSEQQLVNKYNETGDIQGFIVSFWSSTRRTNSRKVLGEKN